MFRPFGSSSAPLPRSAHAPHKHANKPYEPLPSLLANPKHDAALSTRESKLRELTVRLSTRQGGRASTAYLDASKPITIKKVDPNLLTIQAVLSLRLLVRKWRGRRKRTRAGLFSYALNNGALAPPKPLYQWSSHWEHCAKCERCTTDVYDKDRAFFCGHCNVTVCHDCLTRDERGRRAYNRARGFREPPCQWCISEHEQQRQLYQNDKEAMWTDSVYVPSLGVRAIATILRRYCCYCYHHYPMGLTPLCSCESAGRGARGKKNAGQLVLRLLTRLRLLGTAAAPAPSPPKCGRG